jgi:hypothetical protein
VDLKHGGRGKAITLKPGVEEFDVLGTKPVETVLAQPGDDPEPSQVLHSSCKIAESTFGSMLPQRKRL